MPLIVDGIKYIPHIFKEEEELEKFVEKNALEIFGENSVYFSKKKILSSLSGITGIPDAFAITWQDSAPQWYVVEIELSTHPLYEHVVTQLSKFATALTNASSRKKIIASMEDEIKANPTIHNEITTMFGELFKFLSEVVNREPKYLIVIDKETDQLRELRLSYQWQHLEVIEFKTYEREGVGISVSAHLFESLFKPRGSKLRVETKKDYFETPKEVRASDKPKAGEWIKN